MGRRGWSLWAAEVVTCALFAGWLVGRAASGVDRRHADLRLVEAVAPHQEAWVRLLRGVLGHVAVPVLLAVAAVALVALLRGHRWWEAAAVAAVLTGANVTVQAIKHGLLPASSDPPVLSGHMAVAVGAAYAVAVAVPRRWRPHAVVIGVAVTVATGVGVVLAAWHTPLETLAPTGVAAAWVLAAAPLLLRRRGGGSRDAVGARPDAVGARS